MRAKRANCVPGENCVIAVHRYSRVGADLRSMCDVQHVKNGKVGDFSHLAVRLSLIHI